MSLFRRLRQFFGLEREPVLLHPSPPPRRGAVPPPAPLPDADPVPVNPPDDPWPDDPTPSEPPPTFVAEPELHFENRRLRRLPLAAVDPPPVHGLRIESCTRLRSLPDGLTVKGHLFLFQCPQLERLGDRLTVEGNLSVVNCPNLRDIGDEIRIDGGLTVKGCPRFEALPAAAIGGRLLVSGYTRLGTLPDGLTVKGDCVFIRSLDAVRAGASFHGDLVLLHCKGLTRLPDGLKVRGELRASQCANLKEIGQGIEVGQTLDLSQCSSLERLPPVRARNLNLWGCNRLLSLPDDLSIPGWARLNRCTRLSSLPRGLRVGPDQPGPRRRWALWGNLEPGTLELSGCVRLTEIPGDLQAGWVEVSMSGITRAPERLQLLWTGVEVPHGVALDPSSITAEQIFRTRNTEVRRILLERVDPAKLLAEKHVQVLHEDEDPGGKRRLLELRVEHSRFLFLECRCPSTGRVYHLRVPPTVRTCHAAAAWMAGFEDPDEYIPLVET